MDTNYPVYDREALLFRLHEDLKETGKSVVFVVGAPCTASTEGVPGVADVAGVVSLVRQRYASKDNQARYLEEKLAKQDNKYQAAFDFVTGRSGQDAANQIIVRAVSQALVSGEIAEAFQASAILTTEDLSKFDDNINGWHLPPAVDAIGKLAAEHPQTFGKIILTSNFDPLIEVSIRRHNGSAWRTCLPNDGSLFVSKANGSQVVHIHGYWHGGDTLHTSQQLLQSRPTLANDLLRLLQGSVVVVMGYGGWPDIFTKAIAGLVSNDTLMPEILWAFHREQPVLSDYLQEVLGPGLSKNRVTLYGGIDVHTFLPELCSHWSGDALRDATPRDVATNSAPDNRRAASRRQRLFKLSPLECDRPPNIEVWVGRDNELRALETSKAKVVIICGIGGEGKSALASHCIRRLEEGESPYRFWDWRDCKEQSDRIRTQVAEVIVRFSNGRLCTEDLVESDDQELVEVFLDQTADAEAVIVLDNVDSYVDLENRTFTGLLDRLVNGMANSNSTSRIITTCRPDVQYAATSIVTFSIGGLSDEEAIELFKKRVQNGRLCEEDVRELRRVTNGHAFWLDLIAVQVDKVPGTTIPKLIADMQRGRDNVPDVLSSIWSKLALREQTLLRLMAEAVRPETEKQIERFAASELGYAKFNRAFRSLKALNLIVVKPVDNAPDLYDLHPLVRQFVRNLFHASQRISYIRVVINQYQALIGKFGSMLGIHMPFSMLERWSQKVELEVAAGFFEDAFDTLSKAEDALIGGGHLQEYVRVSRLIFEAIEWETAATKYKLFDTTVGITVSALNQLGEYGSADQMLENYVATIPQKTARYIHYCDIKAYSHWLRDEFDEAVDWASRGVSLKRQTNVDTAFESEYTLALAQRDGGDPKEALSIFLQGSTVEELTDPEQPIVGNGPLYGNVGRCLQFLKRPSEALICYRRSIELLENDTTIHSKSNRAYARTWIAEVLEADGELNLASAFYADAIRVLGHSAPKRVHKLFSILDTLQAAGAGSPTEASAMRTVEKWIRG